MMKIKLTFLILFLFFTICKPSLAVDLKEGHAIRDAEIERVLKSFIEPLFNVAGLNPDKLNLILVYDSEVNAAATLDNTIIVNTGFLLEADSASEVIGVFAHETAHIADGHMIRTVDAIENAQMQTLLGTLLGGVVGLAAGQPDLAVGMILGNMEMAKGIFLKHSRVQEGAADQGALRYLDKLGWSANGLLSFMRKLQAYDPRRLSDDIYLYTHPLTQERVAAFLHHVQQGKGKGGPVPAKFEKDFQRAKAKIEGFTLTSQQLKVKYKGSAPLDRYVRAVSAFCSSDFKEALTGIDLLIAESPNDADYWDLKGQILFESGQIHEAVKSYEKAVKLDPKSPLLRELWAQAMLESGDPSYYPKAEQELLRAAKEEPYSPFVWHLLAIVYGKQERMGHSALALAERYLLEGKFDDSANQAKRAKHYLSEGDPLKLRADDILNEVKRVKKLG